MNVAYSSETWPQGAAGGGRRRVSPLARRLAKDGGLDIATLTGTGPRGRIVRADIEQALDAQRKTPARVEAAPSRLSLEAQGIAPGTYDLVPLNAMRRTIAQRLTQSFRDVPHFPLTVDLEIDSLLAARKLINGRPAAAGRRVSVNDMLIKASAMALKAVPEANASFTAEGIALHHHADIAVAVAIEGGLITPIIRAAETKSIGAISIEMKELAARARERKLAPEEFQGGTFSLSNLGMFGVKAFSSIINEPQGCILSVGAGSPRPVVKDGRLAIATVMTVTLTCDHRVVDGSVGARWLQAFSTYVEDPVTMLA